MGWAPLKFLYELTSGDITKTCDCILNGPSFESLVSLITPITDIDSRLQIDEDDQVGDNLAECLLAFYKGPKYNPKHALRVCLSDQPAIDTGGVRRQVFSQVFERLAFSDQFGLFDGPPHRRRPAFRISSLSAGVMKLVGRVIGHSIILDGVGFPYLSPACYYTMVGDQDKALLLCSPEDASDRVQHVVRQVSHVYITCFCEVSFFC